MKKLFTMLLALVLFVSAYGNMDYNNRGGDFQYYKFEWGTNVDDFIEKFGDPDNIEKNEDNGWTHVIYDIASEEYRFGQRHYFIFNEKGKLFTIAFTESGKGTDVFNDKKEYFTKKYEVKPKKNSQGRLYWENDIETLIMDPKSLKWVNIFLHSNKYSDIIEEIKK